THSSIPIFLVFRISGPPCTHTHIISDPFSHPLSPTHPIPLPCHRELSILVLQTKLPALPPSLDEFSASSPRPINSTSVSTSGASSRRTQSEPPAPPAPPAGSRVNTDPDYAALRLRVKGSERLQQELRAQSWADLPLYEEAIRRLCGELHSLGLWAYPEVRKYWAERRPLEVAQCTEDGIGINI
ncbi:hypothetical protein B484DRAFT_421343, partial [Ochromonadaceae sp. CCMP2298]